MWPIIAVASILVAGVLLVALVGTRARERKSAEALGHAKNAVQQASVEAQQAQARVQAVLDVENRYRGVLDLEAAIMTLETRRISLEAEHANVRLGHEQEFERLIGQVGRLRHELAALTDEEYFADFGVYSTRYDFPTAERYKTALDQIRAQQKGAIKGGTAAVCHVPWTVEGSEAKGRKMTADNLKMMVRAFNGECDAAIIKVTYKNIAALEQRIWKTKERIDRLNAVNRSELTQTYVQLKVAELRLFHEYERRREEEREEQRELKDQMREEKRAQQELDKAQKQAEDDEKRYATALAKAREQVMKMAGGKQAKMAEKIAELESRLAEAQANKERAISQAQLTRAGHVYVISNIGSFGEGVLKIGMTRRLDPMDRVKELGDASVPFTFDVHAIIRSRDAPTLERELHRRFADRRVNLVNRRKEFFNVSLSEVNVAVTDLHGDFDLTKLAEAAEFRESAALRQREQRQGPGVEEAPSVVAATSAAL